MLIKGFSYTKLATAFLLWCICWVGLQAVALYFTFGLTLTTSLVDAAITNLLVAMSGYSMVQMMRFYQPRMWIRLGMSIAMAVLCVVVIHYLSPFVTFGNPDYLTFVERSYYVRGLYSWLMITLATALSWLWFSVREQQALDERKATNEKLAREAELSRLQLQLQPHFLFNSLNSISALAGSKPEDARRMIQQLSDFLRGTLKKDDQQLVTLAEELQHLQLYLEIEKVRFGHRLRTEINTDEASGAMKLPSLLLQPVVENAIKFGLYDTTGEAVIAISAKSEPGYLLLDIRNPFDPATAQPRKGTGFGLRSVQRRLYLIFARQDLLTTTQASNVFITSIKIPQSI